MWYSLLDLKQSASGAIQAHISVDDSSPWFSGHFPDNPILPGIAQLGIVADVLSRSTGKNVYIQRLNRIKFKKIVRPSEQLAIEIHPTATTNLYTFLITKEAQDICSGSMLLADKQLVQNP